MDHGLLNGSSMGDFPIASADYCLKDYSGHAGSHYWSYWLESILPESFGALSTTIWDNPHMQTKICTKFCDQIFCFG